MPIKKKSPSRKTRTSVKRKPTPKKTATKKRSTPKLKANAGKIRIEVTKGGKVDGGSKYVWSITLKGLNGESIPAGLVTATTRTEALTKGKRILKKV